VGDPDRTEEASQRKAFRVQAQATKTPFGIAELTCPLPVTRKAVTTGGPASLQWMV